ncbi:MAG TPA: complex I NDUFA9 subunit family protein [Burkholderiales bacterium]|nr:complex I NDUFA9 subunit family protein [Burkholderiales bacterium]
MSASYLVVGGSGFVGRHLVAALAARGARVTVPTRRRERAKHLILLPTVEVIEMEARDSRALARLAWGRDAVINLAGVLHSRRGRRDERGPNDYGPDFARAHVELAQAVVTACREAGVKRLLHMSALGADPHAPSEYLRSKGVGEQAVLAADDLEASAFRPSAIFGPEDEFLNLFARLAALAPVLAVPAPEARFQPVYVGDVVRAMLAALEDREVKGRAYDLCGPHQYTLRQLVRTACALAGHRRLVIGLPGWAAWLQAAAMELLPSPPLTRDNLRSMRVPSVCRSCPDGAFPFGIEPVPLEVAAPAWLAPGGPRGRYSLLRWRAHR